MVPGICHTLAFSALWSIWAQPSFEMRRGCTVLVLCTPISVEAVARGYTDTRNASIASDINADPRQIPVRRTQQPQHIYVIRTDRFRILDYALRICTVDELHDGVGDVFTSGETGNSQFTYSYSHGSCVQFNAAVPVRVPRRSRCRIPRAYSLLAPIVAFSRAGAAIYMIYYGITIGVF